MRTPPRILAVDDDPSSLEVVRARLASQGYEVLTATDGEQALTDVREQAPDLLLLDVMMPRMDGLEVCRRLRSDPARPFTPIIIVTARADSADIVAGLNAGADEYLTKPLDHDALVARVRSILRIKELHDTVQAQAAQLADWNHSLEARVGLMVMFNDPISVPDPAVRAVRMAVAVRERLGELTASWLRRGHDLAPRVGIGMGYATLGKVGFAGRYDYTAIGGVTHLAARLCEEAPLGQILVSQRVHAAVEELVDSDALGELVLWHRRVLA